MLKKAASGVLASL